MSVQSANFGAEKTSILEKFMDKIKMISTRISSCKNLQLFGRIFFYKIAKSVEKLRLQALLLFLPSYDAADHWKFKLFMNSELQFRPAVLHYRTTVLSHLPV